MDARSDLDSPEAVSTLVHCFYDKVLADPLLAPIFLEVAGISLEQHLPRIEAYWCKMLLGHIGYQGHTMALHRAVHRRRPLGEREFERWLSLFTATVDENFAGPGAERGKRLAHTIATNMADSLSPL